VGRMRIAAPDQRCREDVFRREGLDHDFILNQLAAALGRPLFFCTNVCALRRQTLVTFGV
jgi:hypothetical protein